MKDTTQLAERDSSAVARRDTEQAVRRMTLVPAVDVYEDSQGVTLWADLPGVTKDKLDVKVHDSSLLIEAEAVVPTPANLRLQHAEVREPHFARIVYAVGGSRLVQDRGEPSGRVLKLTIPRRDEARPRRIEIKTR